MSFQFHVPPANALSLHQQHALALGLSENECILITGCPGSGKTTVANFRASSLEKQKKQFKYIIYARMLESYVKSSFSNPNLMINEDRVSTFGSWFWSMYRTLVFNENGVKVKPDVVEAKFKRSGKLFKEMIFDETQDLDINIISSLPYIADSLTICADDAQNVYEESPTSAVEQIKSVLENKGFTVKDVHLGINFRNPPEIYAFAKALIPNNPAGNIERFMKAPGQKPVFQVLKDKWTMYERMLNIIRNRRNENIGILCDTKSQINSISNFLGNKGIEHTSFHTYMKEELKKEQLSDMKRVVVCTNKSAKGLEFQTVIIPFVEEMKTDESNRKCYYVACTRAERNLYLMASTGDSSASLLAQINPNLYEKID